MGQKQKKKQECLNNIRIRFSTYENECYAKRTRILRTMRFQTINWAFMNHNIHSQWIPKHKKCSIF